MNPLKDIERVWGGRNFTLKVLADLIIKSA